MGAHAERLRAMGWKRSRPGLHVEGPRQSDRVKDIRLQLLAAGYRPIPANGKRPTLPDWQNKDASTREVARWAEGRHASAHNTGIVLGADVRVIDIDILDENLARRVEGLAQVFLGCGAPIRIGRAPKRAIFYRVEDGGRPKASVALGIGQVELLGRGQMVIVDGTHPDTGLPYTWRGDPLWAIGRSRLPLLTVDAEPRFLDALRLLPEAGEAPEPTVLPQVSGAATTNPRTEPHDIPSGRNEQLFRFALGQARSCETEDQLRTGVHAENLSRFGSAPLPDREVDKLVANVWKNYRQADRIFVPGQQKIVLPAIPELQNDRNALLLLYNLKQAHGARRAKPFAVSPSAMAKRLGIGKRLISTARDRLVELGLIAQVKKGGYGPGTPSLYMWGSSQHKKTNTPVSGYIQPHAETLQIHPEASVEAEELSHEN